MSDGYNERTLHTSVWYLIGVFALTSIILIIPASQLVRFAGPVAVTGARNTLILFITPNIFTFGITAIVIREAWDGLANKERVLMGFVLAATTHVLLMVLALLLGGLLTQSATVMWLIYLIWMSVPGVLAAQMLRYAKSIWRPRAT